MAVPYERFDANIAADDVSADSQSLLSEDGVIGAQGPHGPPPAPNTSQPQAGSSQNTPSSPTQIAANDPRLQRVHELLQNRWPHKVGALHLLLGLILTILGLVQLIVIPLVQDKHTDFWLPSLSKNNCFGIGLWAGILLSMSGTCGIRAALYHSTLAVYTFVIVILVETPLFCGMIFMILTGYASHWTTREVYNDNGALFSIHLAISILIGFGVILVVHAFTQYYEEVFCGEMQLCKRCVHCFCPCVCPRPVSTDELLDENYGPPNERPPSIPV